MPSLNVLIERGEVCRCVRSKTMYYEVDEAERPDADNSAPFWCTHTQSIFGPDGQVVEPGACRPGRGCCEIA